MTYFVKFSSSRSCFSHFYLLTLLSLNKSYAGNNAYLACNSKSTTIHCNLWPDYCSLSTIFLLSLSIRRIMPFSSAPSFHFQSNVVQWNLSLCAAFLHNVPNYLLTPKAIPIYFNFLSKTGSEYLLNTCWCEAMATPMIESTI